MSNAKMCDVCGQYGDAQQVLGFITGYNPFSVSQSTIDVCRSCLNIVDVRCPTVADIDKVFIALFRRVIRTHDENSGK